MLAHGMPTGNPLMATHCPSITVAAGTNVILQGKIFPNHSRAIPNELIDIQGRRCYSLKAWVGALPVSLLFTRTFTHEVQSTLCMLKVHSTLRTITHSSKYAQTFSKTSGFASKLAKTGNEKACPQTNKSLKSASTTYRSHPFWDIQFEISRRSPKAFDGGITQCPTRRVQCTGFD